MFPPLIRLWIKLINCFRFVEGQGSSGCSVPDGLKFRKTISSHACKLQDHADYETWIVEQIAFPQSARLLQKPVKPLQSRLLHPLRRVFHATGMQVERSPDADHQFGIESI